MEKTSKSSEGSYVRDITDVIPVDSLKGILNRMGLEWKIIRTATDDPDVRGYEVQQAKPTNFDIYAVFGPFYRDGAAKDLHEWVTVAFYKK